MNRNKIKSTLLQSLKLAGTLLKDSLTKTKKIEAKTSVNNLVTEIDKAAEKIILDLIQRTFPDHSILSEESPPKSGSSSRWIIDPLDGTTNFAHSFPIASVSIAYEEERIVQLGGVYDPFRDELFFAERGKGATLNGKRIQVSKVPDLNTALLCTGFPYDREKNPSIYLDIVKEFLIRCHGIRRTGSAAIDLCYVACGRFDGYWEFKLNAWDKAAGALMVEEAGGRVSDCLGNSLSLEGIQNLATNGLIHEEMIAIFKKAPNLITKW